MKRFKKPKAGTITLSVSDIKKIKQEVTDIATGTVMLLFLEAAKDELNLDFEQLKAVFLRAERYGKYLDDKLVPMKQMAEDLYKDTGIKIKWR